MEVTVSPAHRDSRTAGQATSGTVRRGRAEDGADADCARDGLPAFRHRPPDGETPGQAQDSINDYRRSESGLPGNWLDDIVQTHLIDPEHLRAADFDAFYAARSAELIALIEDALGKRAIPAATAPESTADYQAE